MSMTLRAMSALLQYPSADLKAAIPEVRTAIRAEGMLPESSIAELEPLLSSLELWDTIESQERYVELFDRGRAHCLHLFEHVHGESRDRGQAMVDLRERYLDAGLDPTTNELPDYLPLFLEYCSVLPREQALEQLAEPGLIIAALAKRLDEKESPYAAVLNALCVAADIDRDIDAQSAIVAADNPHDLEELDANWEAEEITFGAMAPQAPGRSGPPCSTSSNGTVVLPTPRVATARNRSH